MTRDKDFYDDEDLSEYHRALMYAFLEVEAYSMEQHIQKLNRVRRKLERRRRIRHWLLRGKELK